MIAMRLTHIFRLFGALIYDGLVVFSFMVLTTMLLLLFNAGTPPHPHYHLAYLIVTTGIFLGGFWCNGGQTLGMLAWKLRMVDKNHKPISWQRAILRYLLSLPSVFCFGIGFLWCLWDKESQTLHDRLAGTFIHLVGRNVSI